MSINYSKGVYTLKEIAEILLKKCPGRFASLDSANAMARNAARALGITDINGKKRCKLITANDAKAIINEIASKKRKSAAVPKGKPGQMSLFDDEPLEWLDPYTVHATKKAPEPIALPVPNGLTAEQVDAIAGFMQAWKRLCEVYGQEEEM